MGPMVGVLTAAGGAALLYLAGAALADGASPEAYASAHSAGSTEAFQGVRRGGAYAGFQITDADREARFSPAYTQCMDGAQNNADMRRCSATEFRRLEPLMEAAFDTAVGRISNPASRERLRSEQQTWQSGRVAHCERELEQSGEGGGSMGLIILDNCAIGEMVRRTIWLEQR